MNALGALAATALAATPALDAPPAFAPGEETVLTLRFLGMHSGEGRLTVGQPAGDVWPLVFQARTEGIAGFFDIREHVVSYWDSTTGLTRGFDVRAYEVGDFKTERARFDRSNGKVTYEVVRNGRRTKQTFDVPSDVQDLTSAVMSLRLQRLEPGGRHEVPVYTGTRQFIFAATVLGRERIETRAGTFDAVKVQVRTAVEGAKFSTGRDTVAWFSDDARHVILRMDAEFAVGSVVATLKSYRPGDRAARAGAP